MKSHETMQRLNEIEDRLRELMPTRMKADAEPAIFEDYRGELGKAKLEEFERLLAEKQQLETKLFSS